MPAPETDLTLQAEIEEAVRIMGERDGRYGLQPYQPLLPAPRNVTDAYTAAYEAAVAKREAGEGTCIS